MDDTDGWIAKVSRPKLGIPWMSSAFHKIILKGHFTLPSPDFPSLYKVQDKRARIHQEMLECLKLSRNTKCALFHEAAEVEGPQVKVKNDDVHNLIIHSVSQKGTPLSPLKYLWSISYEPHLFSAFHLNMENVLSSFIKCINVSSNTITFRSCAENRSDAAVSQKFNTVNGKYSILCSSRV